MVVVLFSSAEGTPTLRPAAFEQLAELGVTSVSLLRDGSTAAFVFEGWAFNVRRAADAAHAVAGACDGVRTLMGSMDCESIDSARIQPLRQPGIIQRRARSS
jgi:hypothetical protein